MGTLKFFVVSLLTFSLAWAQHSKLDVPMMDGGEVDPSGWIQLKDSWSKNLNDTHTKLPNFVDCKDLLKFAVDRLEELEAQSQQIRLYLFPMEIRDARGFPVPGKVLDEKTVSMIRFQYYEPTMQMIEFLKSMIRECREPQGDIIGARGAAYLGLLKNELAIKKPYFELLKTKAQPKPPTSKTAYTEELTRNLTWICDHAKANNKVRWTAVCADYKAFKK